MGNSNDYFRERQKRNLRKGIIENKNLTDEEDELEEEYEEDEPEREDGYDKSLKRHRRLRRLILMGAVIALAAIGAVFIFRRGSRQYATYQVMWEKDLAEGNLTEYADFGDNLLKFNRDGISCINRNGETVWTQGYEMKSPVVETCGDFGIVADRRGYTMYIFSTEGITGSAGTTLPISRVTIAGQGMAVAILEDTEANYIRFFDKSGRQMDMEVRTLLSSNGYPTDISLSPNGHLLAASYVYLNQGTILNKVIFYNYSSVGKDVQDKLVGGFEHYKETMIGQVEFMTDTEACVITDGGIDFYSTKNEASPALKGSAALESEIRSVFTNKKYLGVITDSNENGQAYELYVYNGSGTLLFHKPMNMRYTHAEFSGDTLLIYNESECTIRDIKGNVRYQGALDKSLSKLVYVSDDQYIAAGADKIRRLKLE